MNQANPEHVLILGAAQLSGVVGGMFGASIAALSPESASGLISPKTDSIVRICGMSSRAARRFGRFLDHKSAVILFGASANVITRRPSCHLACGPGTKSR